MRPSHLCRIVGRALLAGTLGCSVLTSASAALVLHEHGGRAHLHVLVDSDLPSSTAWSWQYGHSPGSSPASGMQGVRVLIVVVAGSVFLPLPDDAGVDEVQPAPSYPSTLANIDEPRGAIMPRPLTFDSPIRFRRSSTATVLTRNHTLLI